MYTFNINKIKISCNIRLQLVDMYRCSTTKYCRHLPGRQWRETQKAPPKGYHLPTTLQCTFHI